LLLVETYFDELKHQNKTNVKTFVVTTYHILFFTVFSMDYLTFLAIL